MSLRHCLTRSWAKTASNGVNTVETEQIVFILIFKFVFQIEKEYYPSFAEAKQVITLKALISILWY